MLKRQSAVLVLDDLESLPLADDFDGGDDFALFDFLAAALLDFALLA
jgi:hypothetical protein